MGRQAVAVQLSDRQQRILERLARRRTIPQRLSERVRIVLMSAEGMDCTAQAARLGVDGQRVRRWRKRWAAAQERLAEAEPAASEEELEELITHALLDEQRPGGPQKFDADEVAQILALACEEPESVGVPISHWTSKELARAAERLGILDSISPRHVGRFLKRGGHSSPPRAVLVESKDR